MNNIRRRLIHGACALAALCVGRVAAQSKSQSHRLTRFHSPNTGASDARVNLVEFLDPACEGCKAFHPAVKKILAEYPGRVRLWIRYLPFHRGADFVVRALEAARFQERYWGTLDVMFAKQDEWTRRHVVIPELVLKALDGTGLDLARLQRDMKSPAIGSILEADMADALALKIDKTPTFYVNGRLLEDYGFDQLRTLVRAEVRRQYP